MSYKITINGQKTIQCDRYTIAEDKSSASFVFVDKDYNEIANFFGSETITQIYVEQSVKTYTYDCRLKRSSITQDFLINESNSAIETQEIRVMLTKVSVESEMNDIKDYIGMVDVSTLTLDEYKEYVQNQNKEAMAKYIADNPVLWTDGKYYGIKQEDQQEMMADLMVYDFETKLGNEWTLEWHNIHKACREFTYEEFCQLLHTIITIVYPIRRLQETYKEQIYSCETRDDINVIEFNYASVDPRNKTDGVTADEN